MKTKQLTLEQISALQFHPLANLFPLLEGAEFDELTKDIEEHGLKEPIVLYEGKILDGRNRYNAMRKLGLGTEGRAAWYPLSFFCSGYPYGSEAATKEEAIAYVVSKNIMRRHLTNGQRAVIAKKLYDKMPKQSPGGDRKSFSEKSENDLSEVTHTEQILPSAEEQKQKAAAMMKVSKTALEQASALSNAAPEKLEEVAAGKKTLGAALREIKEAKASQKKVAQHPVQQPEVALQPKQATVPAEDPQLVKARERWDVLASDVELCVVDTEEMIQLKKQYPQIVADDTLVDAIKETLAAFNELAELIKVNGGRT